MPKSTLAGHPLHPQIISAPAGLLPMSLVMDVMYAATGRESYADAAYYTMVGGCVGGLAAGAAGAADYLSVPPETRAKQLGNVHGAMNVSILGLFGANILMRRGKRPNRAALALNALGNAALLVSAWYGGELVYEEGMRVRGVSPVQNAPEAKLPGDTAIAGAVSRLSSHVPGGGPYIPD